MDSVLKWLMNYCYDHDIGVVYCNDLPSTAPSDSYCNPKLVIFNDNFQNESEKPFMLAHEIGHVIKGSSDFYKTSFLGKEKSEYSANKFAIELLYEYCFENDIWFETTFEFAKAFGVPNKYYYLLETAAI